MSHSSPGADTVSAVGPHAEQMQAIPDYDGPAPIREEIEEEEEKEGEEEEEKSQLGSALFSLSLSVSLRR